MPVRFDGYRSLWPALHQRVGTESLSLQIDISARSCESGNFCSEMEPLPQTNSPVHCSRIAYHSIRHDSRALGRGPNTCHRWTQRSKSGKGL